MNLILITCLSLGSLLEVGWGSIFLRLGLLILASITYGTRYSADFSARTLGEHGFGNGRLSTDVVGGGGGGRGTLGGLGGGKFVDFSIGSVGVDFSLSGSILG